MRVSGCISLALVALVAGGAAGAPTKEGGVVTVEHRDPLTLPSRGPANALVTIELWYSPFLSSRLPVVRAIEKLQAQHPSRIRILYRVIRGSSARLPYAAIYAFSEGKYFEFMDAVNALSRQPDDKSLADIARTVGIDPDRMAAIISKPPAAYDSLLDANEQRRQRYFRNNPAPPNALFNGRLTTTHTSALGASDLEREYQHAKDIADDMLDRGIPQSELAAAFETIPPPTDEINLQPGAIDDGSDDLPADPPLATPPLDTKGWPSYGSANADTTVIVLCSPTSNNCRQPMNNAHNLWSKYPKQVRLVWAPYFKVDDAEDAADLSLLADAALCAEKVGTTFDGRNDAVFDDDASSGWRWVEAMLNEATSRRRDAFDPEKLIDKVAGKLHVDKRAFAACRAQVAGTSVGWIEAARHAGVKTTPATVVGGRVYGPITDLATLQLLVEAELAPGWLAPTWMHADSQ